MTITRNGVAHHVSGLVQKDGIVSMSVGCEQVSIPIDVLKCMLAAPAPAPVPPIQALEDGKEGRGRYGIRYFLVSPFPLQFVGSSWWFLDESGNPIEGTRWLYGQDILKAFNNPTGPIHFKFTK